jgi:hypothetical protein
MSPTYYIYSTRANGWVYRGGNFGTDLAQARQFEYTEAIDYCQKHTTHEGAPICFPCETSMMASIKGKL